MSDENNQQKPDPIAALDSKVTNELSALKQGLNAIGEHLNRQAQAQVKPQKKEVVEKPDPLIDPRGYEEYLRREITQEFDQKLDSKLNAQQNKNAQLAALVNSYPELSDQSSELTRKAVEIFNSMDATERGASNAYRSAVAIAASELGVVPVSKRKQVEGDENFTMSGNGSSQRRSSSRQKEDELPPETLAFAEAIGQDINDPEYLKRLKNAAKRKDYSRFK